MLARIIGVAALVAGVVILVYGGFSVPKNRDAKLGPIEVKVQPYVEEMLMVRRIKLRCHEVAIFRLLFRR